MISFLKKPWRWAWIYSALLTAACLVILLDAFVIPKALAPVIIEPTISLVEREIIPSSSVSDQPKSIVDTIETVKEVEESTPMTPIITPTSYTDENIEITIQEVSKYDTVFYVADIKLTDAAYLKTALAQGTYGRNIKETTSQMAEAHSAILGINGDYYGFRDAGYVLRNGVLYRDNGTGDALVIDSNGDFSIVDQGSMTPEIIESAWQIFSFGPALVVDGEVAVNENSEVSQSKTSNPRTAIAQVSSLHYIIIVSDGRTEQSVGLSLLQLADEFAQRNATTAYNLDGGGSSTMVFNGAVVNTPTSGRSQNEREVSDIVYIGYE